MSDGAATGAGSTVVCERHGLRFDPSRHQGCVLCRREQAGGGSASASGPGSPGRAWLVAALLWVAAGGALYTAHREVLAAFALFTGELAAPAEPVAPFEEDADPWAESDPGLRPGEPHESLDRVPHDPTLDGGYPEGEGLDDGDPGADDDGLYADDLNG